jgi:Protein of unknown function (DUF3551)
MSLFSFVLGALVAAAGLASTESRAEAQNYPWCANFADGAGTNCGFATSERCMATIVGSGGFCTQNDMYKPPVTAAPVRHQARNYRSHKSS